MKPQEKLLYCCTYNLFKPLSTIVKTDSLDLNQRDENGVTAYLVAAQTDSYQCMEILDGRNADRMIKTKIKSNALHEAVVGKAVNSVRYLLSKKFPLDEKRGDGLTALSLALMTSKDVEILRLLLQDGANPNVISKEGVSPLFFAIKT